MKTHLTNKKYNQIIITGFGLSGCSVVSSLLKECSHTYIFPVEFDLMRVSGGLYELENKLVDNWSNFRATSAISNFKKLIDLFDRDVIMPTWKQPLGQWGQGYQRLFNNRFKEISYRFIDKLIAFQGKANEVIYDQYILSNFQWSLNKLRAELLRKNKLMPLEKFILSLINILSNLDTTLYFSCLSESSFKQASIEYLKELSDYLVEINQCENLVFHHAIEPTCIQRGLSFFPEAKLIIVDRNPLDVFVEVQKMKWIPTNNIEDFIHWYKSQRIKSIEEQEKANSNRILRLQFENIVLNSGNYTDIILNFLEIDPNKHINKGEFFKPSISITNYKKYEQYTDLSDKIGVLKTELKEYLYHEK